jgi:ABC-type cobalamin/Fe3+-siderophores transport system ATPase subunit
MESRPAISVRNLQIELSGKVIYENLFFEVRGGSLAVITGVFSPGWSVLLHALAGILPDHHGDIELWGYPINLISRRDMDTNTCLIPRNFKTVFDYSVQEYVVRGSESRLKPLQVPDIQEEHMAWQLLQKMQIEKLAGRKSDFLNHAEHQKVNLARAFMHDAHLLLLDDPFDDISGADQEIVASMLLDYAHVKRHTVLAVIPDSKQAIQLADQLLIFDEQGLVANLDGHTEDYDSAARQILAKVLQNAPDKMTAPPEAGRSGQPF